MKKVVILGCENSHADMFLRFISSNKKYSDVDVTGVFSYDAAAMDKLVARYGVKAMKNFDDGVGEAEGVIVTARHGKYHRLFAEPYLRKGISVFMDKPFTVSEEDTVAFLRSAKSAGAKVCGGSSLKFDATVQSLRKTRIEGSNGRTLGGFVRCPISLNSPHGGFFFYAQHLVDTVGEIFGRYPEKVSLVRLAESLSALFVYKDFAVSGLYADERYDNYYALLCSEKADKGGAFTANGDNPCFMKEFDEFYNMLCGEEQKYDFKELAAPVFVMNALNRAMISGKEESVGEVVI